MSFLLWFSFFSSFIDLCIPDFFTLCFFLFLFLSLFLSFSVFQPRITFSDCMLSLPYYLLWNEIPDAKAASNFRRESHGISRNITFHY